MQLDRLINAFGEGASLENPNSEPPKTGLCKKCLIVFECFRPGEAKSGRKGDFLTFVELVFEVATGESPSRETSMSTPVKTTLRKFRDLRAEGKEGDEVWASL